MERLRIAKDRRHFETADGQPFFWLADTAWTITQRLKWDDADYYMEKRKAQGFTVLQIVALDPEQDEEMRSPAGEKALIDQDLLLPNELYFRYLDHILQRAEHYGFYVLLLPVWGQLVVGDNWGGKTFSKTVTAANAKAFGEWIGRRYRDYSNILWCLGGDRHPIHKGVDYRQIWRQLAEGLAKGCLDKDLKWNEAAPEWENLLLTYHTCFDMQTGRCATMDDFTDDDKWISFSMIQSGHSDGIKNYEYISKEYQRKPVRPVFDGEPAYEKMPKSWPPNEDNLHDEGIVRKRAYWSLFAGAFGHTYGHSSVWCMISEKKRSSFRPYSWFESLDHKGAQQMKYLRDLAESRPFQQVIPQQELISHVCKDECKMEHHQACISEDGKLGFVYLPAGGAEEIHLDRVRGGQLQMWWWNPRDGKCYTQENQETVKPFSVMKNNADRLVVQSPEAGVGIDWVLVIEKADSTLEIPGAAKQYVEPLSAKELEEKVFDW